jgi:GNAT superfamily N-acetyltransferase
MGTVIQMRKSLFDNDLPSLPPGVTLRNFEGASDILTWLDIRRQTFSKERLGVRDWTAEDFEGEMTGKPWWRDDWCWLAEAETNGERQPVGTVVLALRQSESTGATVPSVNWLCVVRPFRRQRIAQVLLAHLERAAMSAGFRELWLETHTAWQAANAFYARAGFEIASPDAKPA